MKKIIAIFGILAFTAGMAFSQGNTSTTNQTGNDHEAYTTQTGLDHQATITQDGGNSEGSIDQTGEENIANILQLGSNNKEASITQIGWKNNGAINQTNTGNYPDLTKAQQYQDGNENSAIINQTGRAVKAFQTQVGDNNIAQIDQLSYVDAYQEQGELSEQGQYGNDNWAAIDQGQNYAANRSQATQLQIGDENKAYIYQRGLTNNVATQNQIGNYNEAFLVQNGRDNFFQLEQIGDGNIVGEEGNAFTQNGDGNKFAGVTNVAGLAFDEDGFAIQSDGATLDLDSYQTGNNNIIGLNQGEGDVGLIQQLGDNNEALLWQGGGANDASIIQTGNGNTAHVMQTP
jgi:hypothetical protein